MPLFRLQNKSLQSIKESSFNLEKDIQRMVEENLEKIFGLKFISSEFSIQGLRIDTLAFDPETSSFVIIEYKRDRSFSVVDQGFAYLSLLFNQPDSFVLEYHKKTGSDIKKINFDNSQSKVIFISSTFTIHQQKAINFKDLPIELWEVKNYNGGIIEFDQLKSPDSNVSILSVTKSKSIEKISQQVKKSSYEDHFGENWEVSKELFSIIRGRILELDSRIVEKFNKDFIGYKLDKNNICTIHTRQNKLNISLIRVDLEDLKDPEKKLKIIPWRKLEWGKQCKFILEKKEDIDYLMFLIRQVYEKFYK